MRNATSNEYAPTTVAAQVRVSLFGKPWREAGCSDGAGCALCCAVCSCCACCECFVCCAVRSAVSFLELASVRCVFVRFVVPYAACSCMLHAVRVTFHALSSLPALLRAACRFSARRLQSLLISSLTRGGSRSKTSRSPSCSTLQPAISSSHTSPSNPPKRPRVPQWP